MELRKGFLVISLRNKWEVYLLDFVDLRFSDEFMKHWSLRNEFTDICVEKIHELGEYGLIWTDGDGFLLKPLGKLSILQEICNCMMSYVTVFNL